MSTLGKIWAARKQILEGVVNNVVRDEFVETVAAYRESICKGCEYYDGECSVAGTGPCCGACGCSLKFKLRSLSSPCGAISKGEDPKWLPVMSQQQEDELRVQELDELQEEQDTGDRYL